MGLSISHNDATECPFRWSLQELILTSLVAALIVSSIALQRERVTALELQAMVYAL